MKKSLNPKVIVLSRICKHISFLHKYYVDDDIEIPLLLLRNEIEEYLSNSKRISKKSIRIFEDKFRAVVFGYTHETIIVVFEFFHLLLTF